MTADTSTSGEPRRYLKQAAVPVDQPWSVPTIAPEYGWPKGTMPGGGVIGIGALGGGWVAIDLAANFKMLGQPEPTIVDVSVGGMTNTPGSNADYEVMLDIVQSGSAYTYLTGKPATIRIYYAPCDSTGMINATRQATADGCDVFVWCWGADEALWDPKQLDAMEAAAASAVAAGMAVFAASGDNDSSDGGSDPANVDAPACCPHVVGCGGTTRPHNLVTHDQETVWNNNPTLPTGEGTGGGFSRHFPQQSWQNGAPHGSGRMVPDLVANADPQTGWNLCVYGTWHVVGGTSAVAPLYAGFFAGLGTKPGFILRKLWANHLTFWDVTKGDNGNYRALVGPDPCTGLGVPRGGRLAARFVKP